MKDPLSTKGKKYSEESKSKMSAYQSVNNPMLGKTHTEENKAKIAEAARQMWAKRKGLV